jgi:HEAT repeat protein
MRTLILTLMMSFLSHSAFGSEGGAIARVLAELEAEEAEGGDIPRLVDLLGDDEPLVKRNAARALCNLAVNDANQVIIAAAGAIPPLVELLRDDAPQVRQAAAGVLCNLAANDDNQVKIADEANAITNLVELLRDDEPEVREEAAGALCNLAVNADNKVRIKSEVSTHDDQELIVSNLYYLAAENIWLRGLLAFINS